MQQNTVNKQMENKQSTEEQDGLREQNKACLHGRHIFVTCLQHHSLYTVKISVLYQANKPMEIIAQILFCCHVFIFRSVFILIAKEKN